MRSTDETSVVLANLHHLRDRSTLLWCSQLTDSSASCGRQDLSQLSAGEPPLVSSWLLSSGWAHVVMLGTSQSTALLTHLQPNELQLPLPSPDSTCRGYVALPSSWSHDARHAFSDSRLARRRVVARTPTAHDLPLLSPRQNTTSHFRSSWRNVTFGTLRPTSSVAGHGQHPHRMRATTTIHTVPRRRTTSLSCRNNTSSLAPAPAPPSATDRGWR